MDGAPFFVLPFPYYYRIIAVICFEFFILELYYPILLCPIYTWSNITTYIIRTIEHISNKQTPDVSLKV
jgi:hypothetical protein